MLCLSIVFSNSNVGNLSLSLVFNWTCNDCGNLKLHSPASSTSSTTSVNPSTISHSTPFVARKSAPRLAASSVTIPPISISSPVPRIKSERSSPARITGNSRKSTLSSPHLAPSSSLTGRAPPSSGHPHFSHQFAARVSESPESYYSDCNSTASARNRENSSEHEDFLKKYIGRRGKKKGAIHCPRQIESYRVRALRNSQAFKEKESGHLRDGLSNYYTPGNIRKSRNSHSLTEEDRLALEVDEDEYHGTPEPEFNLEQSRPFSNKHSSVEPEEVEDQAELRSVSSLSLASNNFSITSDSSHVESKGPLSPLAASAEEAIVAPKESRAMAPPGRKKVRTRFLFVCID